MSNIKLSQDHYVAEGNYRENIKFEDGVGIYVEKLGGDDEENCEVRVWKNGVMKKIAPSFYVELCSTYSGLIEKDYNHDGYIDLSFSSGSESTTHMEEHQYVFLYNPKKKDIDWDKQFIIFYSMPPLYALEEGAEPKISVECSMTIYKDGKVLKDNLQCPENISK